MSPALRCRSKSRDNILLTYGQDMQVLIHAYFFATSMHLNEESGQKMTIG